MRQVPEFSAEQVRDVGSTSARFVRQQRSTTAGRHLLAQMLRVRAVDLHEARLLRQGLGWIHIPSSGHEPLAAIAAFLEDEDLLFLYYRDRPLMHARGVMPLNFAREFLATAESCTAGRAMPLHGSYRSLGIFPPATPTSSQCLPAVGAAWGIKLRRRPSIVVCTIGDASTRQGEFYEALVQAVQLTLPIIFIVEDNGFGISTRTADQLPFRLGIFSDHLFTHVDGRDVRNVISSGQSAIHKARSGNGPTVLWIEFDRITSHTNSDDHRVYRSVDEIEAMEARDPIKLFAAQLLENSVIDDGELSDMAAQAESEVRSAYESAEGEAPPESCLPERDHSQIVSPTELLELPHLKAGETTMVAAFNQALLGALRTFDNTVIFGEDIEDPKGGVFGFTKGLSTNYPGRVVNAALAEATIVGVGVGLGATGFRPILELQFIDFLAPAFNQVLTQLATLRWRSNGDWTAPAILYAPYGAYLPAGSTWHSQSNEGLWTHIPGLRVAVPSTPEDLCGLLWTALRDADPTLLLIPKHVMRIRREVRSFTARGFPASRLVREGGDVTVVSWGNCVELVEKVAVQRANRLSVEVIDLVSLVPCDWNVIERSVAKTGRLVVVCEDSRTGSFGQTVISEMVGSQQRFDLLLSPPILVARDDCHIPFHPALEYSILPDEQRIHEALTLVMR